MKAISLSVGILQSLTLFLARTLPVLFWLILLSTNMFWTLRFIVKCTDYRRVDAFEPYEPDQLVGERLYPISAV